MILIPDLYSEEKCNLTWRKKKKNSKTQFTWQSRKSFHLLVQVWILALAAWKICRRKLIVFWRIVGKQSLGHLFKNRTNQNNGAALKSIGLTHSSKNGHFDVFRAVCIIIASAAWHLIVCSKSTWPLFSLVNNHG